MKQFYNPISDRKHTMLLVVCLLLMQMVAWAGPRSFKQAQAIAERQASSLGIAMQQQTLAKAKARYQQGSTLEKVPEYYVFNNGSNKGFTIVSGDDRFPEVVGYADCGAFDENQMSEGCADFLKAYTQMVEALENGDKNVERLLAERMTLKAGSYSQPTVAPLLGDIAWNQYEPFNNRCPIIGVDQRAVTGCTATAMSQVMMYYQYPKELKADIPAYTTRSYQKEIAGISKGETYDWDNMLPVYKTGAYTQAQGDAVAKLVAHCGAAVKMDYGPSSGANVYPEDLSKFFGYDADLMRLLNRINYNLSEWVFFIDRELTAQRPILYCGYSSSSGHQFVCDGSDGQGFYHINWGWGGLSNGYFDITILDPSVRGAGSGSSTDGYNRQCQMIIGITPDNGQTDEPLVQTPLISVTEAYGCTPSATRTDAQSTFTIAIKRKYGNKTDNAVEAKLAMGVKNADGTYTPISPVYTYKFKAKLSDGSYYVKTYDYKITYAFPEGETVLYDIYSTDDGVTWQKCNYAPKMKPCQFLVSATQLEARSNILSATLAADGELLADQSNKFLLTLKNESSIDYLGEMDFRTNTTDKLSGAEVKAKQYVCVPAGETITRTFSCEPSAGDLYIWIVDEEGKVQLGPQKFTISSSTSPVLKLVSKTINATPDDYEVEKAYYQTNRVKMPKINADKAEIRYTIKNDGGTYRLPVKFTIYAYDGTSTHVFNEQQDVLLEGNGATTNLDFSFSPEDIGGVRSFKAFLNSARSDVDIDISGISEIKIWLIDRPSYYYELTGTHLAGYIAGSSSTGIGMVEKVKGIQVSTEAGVIVVRSAEDVVLPVYQLNGQLNAKIPVKAGMPTKLHVRPGVYVVAGTKVSVK